MTDQQVNLARAFLLSQPSSAASVLEQQPIDQVASFLRAAPYRHSAAVLKRMLPQYTARLCKYLEPVVCAGFMSEMDISHIAAILRHTDDEISNNILALLPERTKLTCNLLLNYPETAVGAWMSTNFIAFPVECNMEEARKRISSAEDAVNVDTVFVVDRERQLQGKIGLIRLFKEPSNKLITSVMKKNPIAISGRSSLISISNDPIWNNCECVAVINRNHQLIGVLRHLDLRRGLNGISNTISEPKGSDPIAGIWDVYGNSLLELFNTLGEATNITKP